MRKTILACAAALTLLLGASLSPVVAQSGTISNPKILNQTRNVEQYATAGAGTSASKWTGWEAATIAAIQAGYPVHFSAGVYATDGFVVPVLTTNATSKLTIEGDGSGTTGIVITATGGQFRVYASGAVASPSSARTVLNATIRGLRIEAGVDNTAATGMVSLENFDIGCTVDDLMIDATSAYKVTLGFHLLNSENMTFGRVSVRGWSATSGAAGNVTLGVKLINTYASPNVQLGNINFDSLYTHNCTTALSVSSTSSSFNNIRFGTFKAVNSTLVDGTTGISLASNAEQITFEDVHVEKFQTGLTATAVEGLVILNSLWSYCRNNASSAGVCISIVDGDGGTILSPRMVEGYTGLVLSGTTSRYFTTRGKFESMVGSPTSVYSDTSTGRNHHDDGTTSLTVGNLGANEVRLGDNGVVFEGSTGADTFQGILKPPVTFTADRTWLLPDHTGSLATLENAQTWTAAQTYNSGVIGTLTGSVVTGSGASIVATDGTYRGPNGTSLPPTCSTGQEFFLTNATVGQNKYGCTAPNVWTLMGDGGGVVAFNAVAGGTNSSSAMVVGSGASMSATGSGVITATAVPGTGVSGNISGTAANVSGTVDTTHGGTNITAYAQGDLLFASATNVLGKLAKSTVADRYLCNTGTTNNPAWCQIVLSVDAAFSGALGATHGGTGLTTGTSGGLNYWSSTTTMASSGLLVSTGIVIGGGAGAAPSTSAATATAGGSIALPTAQTIDIAAHATDGGSMKLKEGADDGTNTFTIKVPDGGITASKTVTLVTGTANLPASAIEDAATVSKCARFNASGILVAASGDCSAGGGGTGTVEAVGAGCSTGLCWTDGLATAGTRMWTWEGTTANSFEVFMTAPLDPTADFEFIIPDGAAVITYPIATDTLVGKATTDSLTNKTLNVESTGNVVTTLDKVWFPAAGCVGSTAASFWDLPSSAPTPNCVTGSETQKAYLDFPDTDGVYAAETTLQLPADWTGNIDAIIRWVSAATTGDVVWALTTACVADGQEIDGGPTGYSTASEVADTAQGTASRMNSAAIANVVTTTCAAGELMHLQISRDRTATTPDDTLGAAAARLVGVELTLRRAQ